jgi:hypothetical protein
MSSRKKGKGKTRWTDSGLLWLGGLAVLVGLLVLPTVSFGSSHHPEPRAEIGAEHVVPAQRYEAYPRVQQVYEMVAEIPHVIDGIYCYCDCSEHAGHYSLLDCYNSDHAARCDICLSEAAMAHRMHKDGKSLDQIRTAIDHLYRT